MRVLFCFVTLVLAAGPSWWRCKNAQTLGFTDAPPFDGVSVELHFVDGYNETELEETISALQDLVLHSSLCKDERKREQEAKDEEQRKREERDKRLKALWNIEQLEHDCEKAKKEYAALLERNKQKWFWDEPERGWDPVGECPCGRSFNADTGDWGLGSPCSELDCARKDILFGGNCHVDEQFWYPPLYVPPKEKCVNKIKLRV